MRIHRWHAAPILTMLWYLPGASPGAAADKKAEKKIEAPPDAEPHGLELKRASPAPEIDGTLNDPVWQAQPLELGSWVSYNPLFGESLAQRTEVWAAYDDEFLYFAFRCRDPEPDKVKSSVSRRDTIWNDDWVGVSLDSVGNQQSTYEMFVNPNGIQADILNSSTSGESTAPDWVWDSAARRTAAGYEVEIRLPLKSIRFKSGAEVRMGLLFWRRVSRIGMSASWPSLPPGRSFFTRHAPALMHNLKQPLKLELVPNLTYSWNQERAEPGRWGAGERRPDAGLTVKYGITSSITLDGTFRPDFSQVESDSFQIAVNRRYPIFYSEKRPFFMEGMGTFELAGAGGDGNMRTAVHTRRIVDPVFGAKLTGTMGRMNFATLTAADDAPGQGDAPAGLAGQDKWFNIARFVYPMKDGSYAGGLLVDTEFGPGFNRVAAGDVSLQLGEHTNVSTTLIGTQSRNSETLEPDSGSAGQAMYSYGSRRYNAAVQVEHYDTGFRMDTAFFNRTGYTGGWAYFCRNFYPDQERQKTFKRFAPFVFTSGGRDRPQGGHEAFGLAGARFYFTRQGYLRLDAGGGQQPWAGRELQLRMWRVMGEAQLYKWLYLDASMQFYPRAPYYDDEDPYTGTEKSFSLGATVQPNEKLKQQVSFDHDRFDRLNGGGKVYTVDILNWKTTYQFDKHFSARGIVRYDSSEKRFLTDLLAAFEFVPGTVAYLGYGGMYERRGWDGRDWLPKQGEYLNTRRGLFFKLSYLHRF